MSILRNSTQRPAAQSERDFQPSEDENQSLAGIFAMLKPVGDFSVETLHKLSGYARRHPLRVGITLAGIAYLATRITKAKTAEDLH